MSDNKKKPAEKAEEKPVLVKATVVTSFRQEGDFDKVYPIGEQVEFSQTRIDYLVGLGLVEAEKAPEAPAGGGDKDPK